VLSIGFLQTYSVLQTERKVGMSLAIECLGTTILLLTERVTKMFTTE
jgi:hypothetical protein